jgi:hypothetical protein
VSGLARAFCLAFVVGGCGTRWWQLIPIDASVGPDGDAGPSDVNVDAPGSDALVANGPCKSDSECVPGWRCDPRMLWCVECVDDTDCKVPRASHCAANNTCVECVPERADTCGAGMRCDVNQCFYSCADGGGCPAVAPLCNTSFDRFVCASCLTNDDCADSAVPNSVCQTTSGPISAQCESDQTVVHPPGPDASSALDSGDASDDVAPDTWATDATDEGG